ncbi:hypothetical protein QO003_001724 [Arthrobacter silviterrae]|nr:hypothetical protein [Arthrobacter silviterrae]
MAARPGWASARLSASSTGPLVQHWSPPWQGARIRRLAIVGPAPTGRCRGPRPRPGSNWPTAPGRRYPVWKVNTSPGCGSSAPPLAGRSVPDRGHQGDACQGCHGRRPGHDRGPVLRVIKVCATTGLAYLDGPVTGYRIAKSSYGPLSPLPRAAGSADRSSWSPFDTPGSTVYLAGDMRTAYAETLAMAVTLWLLPPSNSACRWSVPGPWSKTIGPGTGTWSRAGCRRTGGTDA